MGRCTENAPPKGKLLAEFSFLGGPRGPGEPQGSSPCRQKHELTHSMDSVPGTLAHSLYHQVTEVAQPRREVGTVVPASQRKRLRPRREPAVQGGRSHSVAEPESAFIRGLHQREGQGEGGQSRSRVESRHRLPDHQVAVYGDARGAQPWRLCSRWRGVSSELRLNETERPTPERFYDPPMQPDVRQSLKRICKFAIRTV